MDKLPDFNRLPKRRANTKIKNVSFTGKQVVQSKKPESELITELENLGLSIRYKRTSLGKSIQSTASLCNISPRTLHNMEKGVDVKFSNVLKVASMLGLEIKISDK